MDRMSISKAEHLKAVKDFAWTAWVWLMWSTAGEMGLLCRAEMKMWLCWDGNRLFQQWVLPLSLWCSIDSFFISWLRHSGTAANSKAPHFFFFFFFFANSSLVPLCATQRRPWVPLTTEPRGAAQQQDKTWHHPPPMQWEDKRRHVRDSHVVDTGKQQELQKQSPEFPSRPPPTERFFKNP